MTPKQIPHVLSVTVRDQPGVLLRIASLFARRGYNIESLSVSHTETPGISRTTFVVRGEDFTVEQVEKQLQKLVDVLKVVDHSDAKYVDRELMLLKVRVGTNEDRTEIRQIAADFRARIVDVHRSALIFELTGDEGKNGSVYRSDAPLRHLRSHSHRTHRANKECRRPESKRCESAGESSIKKSLVVSSWFLVFELITNN